MTNGLEWNFTTVIRQKHQTTPPREERREEGEEGREEEGGEEEGGSKRDTLIEDEEEDRPQMVAIDDTAFVATGHRSSIVAGKSEGTPRIREEEEEEEGESSHRKWKEGEGEGEEEGEKGGGVPERTRGDGQEAEGPPKSTRSSTLEVVILPLIEQVRELHNNLPYSSNIIYIYSVRQKNLPYRRV